MNNPDIASRILELETGYRVKLKPVSSYFVVEAQKDIPDPEIPQYYIESQKRWVENPHHPAYERAKQIALIQRSVLAMEAVYRHGCELIDPIPPKDSWIKKLLRSEFTRSDAKRLSGGSEKDLEVLFLSHLGVISEDDRENIVKACCLCEEEVWKYVSSLGISRHGININEAQTRHNINTGIETRTIVAGNQSLVSPLDEFAACSAGNCSWWEWRTGQYTVDFMIETVGLYRCNRLIELHSNDAQITESERKSKRKS